MSIENSPQSETNHLYCPHFQNVDEQTLRKLFSKVAAIRSEDKELFEFTHRPIEVFRSPQGTQTEEQVVGEAEVYNEFSDDRVGNFSVVIEGEVGTGKSELCAYLAHRLAAEANRPILHVDKDDDLMTLLSERIPEFHQEHFDEELPGASNFEQLRKDLTQNGSVVANNATSGAILNLSARGYEVDAADKEDQIREFVQDELSLLVEKGEYAKEVKFVTEQAYRRNDFLQVIEDDVDISEAVTAFNDELWREIRERYNTASLDDVLEQVGDQFTDTRPVIIFEDFAITAMEGERLRNYMERDKGTDNWDFIVAGTRDSTEILHTQTAEDRFEFYRTNRQNSNSVLFLNKDSAVDFIRPYLGYIKSLDDNSVAYDRSGDGLKLDLKPAPEGSVCAECGFCDESFRDLFPFNEPFLRRIYTGLSEDEQSPREFVMAVFDVLRDYYEGYVSAPSDADRLGSLSNQLDPSTEVIEDAKPIAMLAQWYGTQKDNHIEVDKRFFAAFGLTSLAKKNDQVELNKETVLVHSGVSEGSDIGGSSGEGDDEGSDGGDDGGSEGGSTPELKKYERDLKELRPNVQSWRENPSNFSEINRYLRKGLSDAIDRLTDGFVIFEGTDLGYNVSSEQDPFVFSSSKTAPEDDQIIIDPKEFRIADLQRLLKFGIYRDYRGANADYEELLMQLGTQLTGYARKWQAKIKKTNLRSGDCLFKQRENYRFEDFALAAYAYTIMLDSPFEEITAETLSKKFADSGSYSLDSELSSALKEELTKDEYQAIKAFFKYSDKFEELVGAFFGASNSALDVATVRSRLELCRPYDVLSGLGRGYINNISHRVRFDTKNKLRDIADATYDLHSALQEAEDEYRREITNLFIEELSAITLSELDETITTLKTYDSVDKDMIETLTKFTNLNQIDIDTAVEAASLGSELISGKDTQRLQAILISMKLGETSVYQRYDDITIVGGGGTSAFAEQFQSVGEHYVN